jgi:hypothetical protein
MSLLCLFKKGIGLEGLNSKRRKGADGEENLFNARRTRERECLSRYRIKGARTHTCRWCSWAELKGRSLNTGERQHELKMDLIR